jgi:hypothetical protein
MRVDEVYQTNSEWLKAKDLNGRDCNCRISDISDHTFEAMGDRPARRQIVLHFGNLPTELAGKKFGLNVTNAMTITELYGPETDDWIGRYITLFPTKTRDQSGNWVDCIRLRNVPPQRRLNGNPKPPPPTASPQLTRQIEQRQGYQLASATKPISETVAVGESSDEIPW